MRSLQESLEAEEKDELPEVIELGDRPLTAYEREALARDPTLPIYGPRGLIVVATLRWEIAAASRSRSIPVTVTRGARVLSEGQP